MTKKTDLTTAIAVLLVAEATLFFAFLFFVGPIATLERLVPLAVVLALSAALYWGQEWARWLVLAPIAFRVWRVVLLVGAAWGLGRTGTALFLAFIILAELFAGFIFVESYIVGRSLSGGTHATAVPATPPLPSPRGSLGRR